MGENEAIVSIVFDFTTETTLLFEEIHSPYLHSFQFLYAPEEFMGRVIFIICTLFTSIASYAEVSLHTYGSFIRDLNPKNHYSKAVL
jgi:hypothetical protein